MISKVSTFHYCGRCRITTSHDVMGDHFTCRRCGSVKTETRAKSSRHVSVLKDQPPATMGQSACTMGGAADAILN